MEIKILTNVKYHVRATRFPYLNIAKQPGIIQTNGRKTYGGVFYFNERLNHSSDFIAQMIPGGWLGEKQMRIVCWTPKIFDTMDHC